jgi:Uma2 family endonuclease
MATSILFNEQFEIPLELGTLAGFRSWALSDGFPDRGRIDYVGGRIEVDMSPEDLFTHGAVKTELVIVLGRRVKEAIAGSLFTDSTRVTCPAADLSVEPDIVIVTDAALDRGAVRLVEKRGSHADRYVELEGGPDLIVEIVSDTSVGKDTRRLPSAYFGAGVAEFWLIDARGAELAFAIRGRGDDGFDPVPVDADGFQASAVLGRRYRLDRERSPRGHWRYDLREIE